MQQYRKAHTMHTAQTDTHPGIRPGIHPSTQPARQSGTDRQAGRQAYRQTIIQANSQAGRQDIQAYRKRHRDWNMQINAMIHHGGAYVQRTAMAPIQVVTYSH